MKEGNLLKLNLNKIEKNKNIFFDKDSQSLYEIKKYNLKDSNSAILASIYIEYSSTNDETPKILNDISKDIRNYGTFDRIIEKKYNFSKEEVGILINILCKYNDKEKLIIINNLPHLKPEKIIRLLNNFKYFNKKSGLKKYNLNEINDFTLYFLLKRKNIDLMNKIESNNDKKRKYIIDFLSVIKNDLRKSTISEILNMEIPLDNNKIKNKQIKLLNSLIENRIIT